MRRKMRSWPSLSGAASVCVCNISRIDSGVCARASVRYPIFKRCHQRLRVRLESSGAGAGVAAAAVARSNEYDERVAALGERAVHTDLRLIDWTPLPTSQHKAAPATPLSRSVALAERYRERERERERASGPSKPRCDIIKRSIVVARSRPASALRAHHRHDIGLYTYIYLRARRCALGDSGTQSRVYASEREGERANVNFTGFRSQDQDMFTFTLYLGNGGIRTMQRAKKALLPLALAKKADFKPIPRALSLSRPDYYEFVKAICSRRTRSFFWLCIFDSYFLAPRSFSFHFCPRTPADPFPSFLLTFLRASYTCMPLARIYASAITYAGCLVFQQSNTQGNYFFSHSPVQNIYFSFILYSV